MNQTLKMTDQQWGELLDKLQRVLSMNKADFQELVAKDRFSPFTITLNDGFAVVVREPNHVLLGRNMIVLLDRTGDIIHIPYRSIAHIQEAK